MATERVPAPLITRGTVVHFVEHISAITTSCCFGLVCVTNQTKKGNKTSHFINISVTFLVPFIAVSHANMHTYAICCI